MRDQKINGRNDIVKRGAAIVSTNRQACETYTEGLSRRLSDRQRIDELEKKMDTLIELMTNLNKKN